MNKSSKFILLGLCLLFVAQVSMVEATTPAPTTTMAAPRITTEPGKLITQPKNAPWYDQPADIALVLIAFNATLIVFVGPLLVLSYRQGQKNWR